MKMAFDSLMVRQEAWRRWKPRAEKGGRQPQPSLAWYEGNLGCEA